MEQRRARGLQTSDPPGDPCRAVGLASSACSSASSCFPLPCRGSCGAFQAHLLYLAPAAGDGDGRRSQRAELPGGAGGPVVPAGQLGRWQRAAPSVEPGRLGWWQTAVPGPPSALLVSKQRHREAWLWLTRARGRLGPARP